MVIPLGGKGRGPVEINSQIVGLCHAGLGKGFGRLLVIARLVGSDPRADLFGRVGRSRRRQRGKDQQREDEKRPSRTGDRRVGAAAVRSITGDAHFRQQHRHAQENEPLEPFAVAFMFLGLVFAACESGQVIGVDLTQVIGVGSGGDVRPAGGQGNLLEQLVVALDHFS